MAAVAVSLRLPSICTTRSATCQRAQLQRLEPEGSADRARSDQRPARAACAHPGPPPSRGVGHKVKDEVLWLLLSEVVP